MRKFLLLIFVSFIALSCRKQVVEPILGANSPSKLPKKIITTDNENGKIDTTQIKYNINNLIELVTYHSNKDTILFKYNNNKIESRIQLEGNYLNIEKYDYDNNKIKKLQRGWLLLTDSEPIINKTILPTFNTVTFDFNYVDNLIQSYITRSTTNLSKDCTVVNYLINEKNDIQQSTKTISISLNYYSDNTLKNNKNIRIIQNQLNNTFTIEYFDNNNLVYQTLYSTSKFINFQKELNCVLPLNRLSVGKTINTNQEQLILEQFIPNNYLSKIEYSTGLIFDGKYSFDNNDRLLNVDVQCTQQAGSFNCNLFY